MAVAYSETLRHNRLDEITAAVGSSGLLRIYDGSRPGFGGTATNLLAEFTLADPFAPGATGGDLSPTLPSDVTAGASGTATWFRVLQSDGTTTVMDGDAGEAAADLILNDAAIVEGGTVSVTGWTITHGNA